MCTGFSGTLQSSPVLLSFFWEEQNHEGGERVSGGKDLFVFFFLLAVVGLRSEEWSEFVICKDCILKYLPVAPDNKIGIFVQRRRNENK